MQEQEEESGPTDTHDLILRGARVIDPSQNLDRADRRALSPAAGSPRNPWLPDQVRDDNFEIRKLID